MSGSLLPKFLSQVFKSFQSSYFIQQPLFIAFLSLFKSLPSAGNILWREFTGEMDETITSLYLNLQIYWFIHNLASKREVLMFRFCKITESEKMLWCSCLLVQTPAPRSVLYSGGVMKGAPTEMVSKHGYMSNVFTIYCFYLPFYNVCVLLWYTYPLSKLKCFAFTSWQ